MSPLATFVVILTAATVLYLAGRRYGLRGNVSARRKMLTAAGFSPLAIPALLISAYYLHLFDEATWFYECRSWPGTEFLAVFAGLPMGLVAGQFESRLGPLRSIVLALFLGLLTVPYVKPVFGAVPPDTFQDAWTDGVCHQSTASSCGVASAATLLALGGVQVTEQDLARECWTGRSGTENWFIARALRRRGCRVTYRQLTPDPTALPCPAIAGVKIGGIGHFIPILQRTAAGRYVTGDPLTGRKEFSGEELLRHYTFTGFFMAVTLPPARTP